VSLVLFDALHAVPASLRRSIKVIIRGVTALGFSVDVRGVATFGGRLPAVGVHTLNGSDVAEQAVSSVAYNIHQQPGDRVGIERVDMRHGFTRDLTTIRQLPRGTSKNDGRSLCLFGRADRHRDL